jgi:hypothetical protein
MYNNPQGLHPHTPSHAQVKLITIENIDMFKFY